MELAPYRQEESLVTSELEYSAMVWPSVLNPSDCSYNVIRKFRIRLSTNQRSARITGQGMMRIG